MKNINQLEKQRLEVLNNMSTDEIIKLYENLSEELVSYYWSYKNNFKGNPEGIKRINKRFSELDKELKHKYRTDYLFSKSLALSLMKEFDSVNEEFYNYDVKTYYGNYLLIFDKYSNLFNLLLWLLGLTLDEFYTKYKFKYDFGYSYRLEEYIIEKFNLDFDKEEDLKLIMELEDKASEIDREENEKRFKKIERDFNFLIEHFVNLIEEIIAIVKDYGFLDFDIEITEDTIEEVVPILESFKKLQEEYKTSLDKYEHLKINPFKIAIEVFVKIEVKRDKEEYERIKERFEKGLIEPDEDEEDYETMGIEAFDFLLKDYDERLSEALDKAPKYDFNKFELIEPERR